MSNQLDTYHYHEAMDRTFVFMEIFESHIKEHPVIVANKNLYDIAQNITDQLFSLYQKTTFTNYEFDKNQAIQKEIAQ